ncbi:hypothetical protein BDP27DRAFT_1428553 [Rhodocollybia butyracea]|uniref:Uncharacterized protein n=1 Tax=Rhodocollybia butyracea TaxID=206335 RepID=A0A9P5U0F5_9AGAR|nr:hypothetical protein BDP27DRAFT_1428553 [Rhodocollybia butyracea]
MTSPDVWILVDDTRLQTIPAFRGNNSWEIIGPGSGPWVGNTSTSTEIPQSILFSFQGTTVSFTGNISSSTNSTGFFAGIDANAPYQVPYPNTTTPVYGQWYQTPILSDDRHTINLSSIVVDLDYAIVIPGPTTPLSGSTIIVDDSNTNEIVYVGHKWSQNTAPINFVGGMSGMPMGNSTHSTCTKGDGFKFQFAGSKISVYGFSEGTNTGSISIDFTLDGKTTPFNLSLPVVGTAASQFSTPHRFFSADSIDAGNHTLQMNVTDAFGNQTFVFDYITYVASYSNLGSKPNFTASTPNMPSPSSNWTSAGSTPTCTPASTRTPAPASLSSSTSHKNIGPIVGGIIGGVGGLAIMLVVLWLVFRNWRKQRNNLIPEIYSYQPSIPQPEVMPVQSASTKSRLVSVRHDFTTQRTPHSADVHFEPWVIEPLIQSSTAAAADSSPSNNKISSRAITLSSPDQASASPTPGITQARTEARGGETNTTSCPPDYSLFLARHPSQHGILDTPTQQSFVPSTLLILLNISIKPPYLIVIYLWHYHGLLFGFSVLDSVAAPNE